MNHPKITIVTPSYNQGDFLEQTIVSVLDQNYPNLEYIVIDGGSKDQSVEVIRKYQKHLSYWVSEKDKGQCDAINKGLNRFSGDLFNWLNSDDYLLEGALAKLADAYMSNPEARAFCFSLHHLKGGMLSPYKKVNDPSDNYQCIVKPVINQPSTFYHRDAVRYLRKLNPELHYTMDYEWWVRFILKFGTKAVYASSDSISVFRIHEDSKTSSGLSNFDNDIANVLINLCEKYNYIEFVNLLEAKYNRIRTYELEFDPKDGNRENIEMIVKHFLLKKSRLIFMKTDFEFAKSVVDVISEFERTLHKEEIAWVESTKKIVNLRMWLLFKIFRKLFPSSFIVR